MSIPVPIYAEYPPPSGLSINPHYSCRWDLSVILPEPYYEADSYNTSGTQLVHMLNRCPVSVEYRCVEMFLLAFCMVVLQVLRNIFLEGTNRYFRIQR